ncbi:MAG TPA: hypothetical protein VIS96_18200 [Terrimicrobiaceae bacterium]
MAAEITWTADALSAWIGKYPTTMANGMKSSILEQEFIKHYLNQAIPEKERRLLNSYDVETPVRQIGSFIVLTKCRPHNCPSELAMIVIDLRKPRLWAGFFSRETGRISTRWYGNADDYSVLPPAIQREFVALHGD